MNPPLFATLFLFLGPIAVLLGGRAVFLLLCALGVVGSLVGVAGLFQAVLLFLPVSYFLTLLGAPSGNQSRGVLLWSGLCCVPLWAPQASWLWRLWPGHALSGPTWNPIAGGWFYQSWGSSALLPTPSYLSILLSHLGLCLLLRCCLHLAGTIKPRVTALDQRDET